MSYTKIENYTNYDDYLEHQTSKNFSLDKTQLYKKYNYRVEKFIKRLAHLNPFGECLVLGARQGCELDAFKKLGATATGIDLVPMSDKVLACDFHHLFFLDSTFDLVYSNSLDHSNMPEVFFNEACRVLKVGGRLVIDYARLIGKWEAIEFKNPTTDIPELLPKNMKLLDIKTDLPNIYKGKHTEWQFAWSKTL